MYKIFVVEDDSGIADAIRTKAALWDYDVKTVENFRKVTEEAVAFEPHLILLDISLPFYNGFYWCTEIRKVSKVPILFITSTGDQMNLLTALNLGADDLVVKPFDGDVLMAKIGALLRRTYDFAGTVSVLEHRGAFLNTGDNTLTYGDERIALTKNEYRILLCLMENKGRVVSRERLMERLWQTDLFVDENTLTVNVNRLRKKLDAAGLTDFITTKFGSGYLLEEEP